MRHHVCVCVGRVCVVCTGELFIWHILNNLWHLPHEFALNQWVRLFKSGCLHARTHETCARVDVNYTHIRTHISHIHKYVNKYITCTARAIICVGRCARRLHAPLSNWTQSHNAEPSPACATLVRVNYSVCVCNIHILLCTIRVDADAWLADHVWHLSRECDSATLATVPRALMNGIAW